MRCSTRGWHGARAQAHRAHLFRGRRGRQGRDAVENFDYTAAMQADPSGMPESLHCWAEGILVIGWGEKSAEISCHSSNLY